MHEEPATSLAELPQSSVILTVLAQLPLLASRSNSVDDSALLCSQKVIQVLFRADSELAREVASALLERLCGLSDSTAQKIRAWLVFANDERKFNLPVVSILIKQGVLGLSDFEGQLAKVVLKESQPSTINFLSQLVRHLLTNKIASREQLMRAIEALFRVNQQGMGTELSHRLETDLKRDNKQPMVLREKLIRHFVDWVRWYQGPKQDEDAFQDYIDSLQEDGVLTSENLMSLFFRSMSFYGSWFDMADRRYYSCHGSLRRELYEANRKRRYRGHWHLYTCRCSWYTGHSPAQVLGSRGRRTRRGAQQGEIHAQGYVLPASWWFAVLTHFMISSLHHCARAMQTTRRPRASLRRCSETPLSPVLVPLYELHSDGRTSIHGPTRAVC